MSKFCTSCNYLDIPTDKCKKYNVVLARNIEHKLFKHIYCKEDIKNEGKDKTGNNN